MDTILNLLNDRPMDGGETATPISHNHCHHPWARNEIILTFGGNNFLLSLAHDLLTHSPSIT